MSATFRPHPHLITIPALLAIPYNMDMREFKNPRNPVIFPGGNGVPRLPQTARPTIVLCPDCVAVHAGRARADAVVY